MKRKILVSALAIALVAVLSLGATIAYFQAQTEEVTNTFTFGNVSGELTEPSWTYTNSTATNLVPGDELDKDPQIKLGDKSLDAYAFMKITIPNANILKSTTTGKDETTTTNAQLLKKLVGTVDTGWTLMNSEAIAALDKDADEIVYIYGYNTKLTQSAKTDAIFTKVTVPTGIDEEDVAKVGEIVNGVAVAADGPLADGFTIDVKGYLIQADNIADLATAYAGVDFTK